VRIEYKAYGTTLLTPSHNSEEEIKSMTMILWILCNPEEVRVKAGCVRCHPSIHTARTGVPRTSDSQSNSGLFPSDIGDYFYLLML
jgi:hypothetical protein